ncbi:MAG: alpha/beta fold hydrolase [Nocardioides sp.]|uniref:alpha/beta fold hydrolase n=1 Tax=Nocardioides sp. TaxID=35761 RepID=UPI0039E593A2
MILERYEWGDPEAPPLVLIHGVGSNGRSFARAAERWAERFRVVAFDLRGHDRSGWDPPWTHATYVADLIESVDALGLARPDWLGYSFGGRLLIDMAVSHPERIGSSILLEPVIRISPELAHRRAQEELTGDLWPSAEEFLAAHAERDGDMPEGAVEEALADFDTLPDGRIRRRTSQAAIVSIFSEFAAEPPPPSTLTRPTQLIYAPAFGLVTAEQVTAYRPHLDDVVEVPGLHSVFWAAFEETVAAVERFLTTSRPSRT